MGCFGSTAVTFKEQPKMNQATYPPEAIKVMTFNIRYGEAGDDFENKWFNRKGRVAAQIKAWNPDLLGLQEALDYQAEYIQSEFVQDGTYGFHGVGRLDGKNEGEFSALIYRKSRFELLDDGHVWLTETPDEPGSKGWDAQDSRMASWVQLLDKVSGKEIIFCNAHIDNVGGQSRVEACKMMRERYIEGRKVKKGGDGEEEGNKCVACLFTGDFNDGVPSACHSMLVQGGDQPSGEVLIDSFRAANPEENKPIEGTYNAFKLEQTDWGRLDWIIHSEELATVDCTINHMVDSNGLLASDHFPVQAVLEWKQ